MTVDFPLSKTYDPMDLAKLGDPLAIVDQYFTLAESQHQQRRWEYAIALHALTHWKADRDYRYPRAAADVGGSGSPFYRMIDPLVGSAVEIIDPSHNQTLADYLSRLAESGAPPSLFDAVFCLSVLEHVDDLERFVYHLSCLVAPGGLLVLTTDYCDAPSEPPEDRYHFHWMRKRIFSAYSLGALVTGPLYQRDFLHFGPVDYTWHGPQVYDYTFASLCLTKRP